MSKNVNQNNNEIPIENATSHNSSIDSNAKYVNIGKKPSKRRTIHNKMYQFRFLSIFLKRFYNNLANSSLTLVRCNSTSFLINV